MINTELFQKINDRITAHPGSFDMDSWEGYTDSWDGYTDYRTQECHTTRCVAGWAIYETTGKQLFEADGSTLHESVTNLAESYGFSTDQPAGDLIVTVGAKVLGLEREDANALFHAPADGAHEVVEAFAEGQNDLAMELLNDEPEYDDSGYTL